MRRVKSHLNLFVTTWYMKSFRIRLGTSERKFKCGWGGGGAKKQVPEVGASMGDWGVW